jgi:hypothetical protein
MMRDWMLRQPFALQFAVIVFWAVGTVAVMTAMQLYGDSVTWRRLLSVVLLYSPFPLTLVVAVTWARSRWSVTHGMFGVGVLSTLAIELALAARGANSPALVAIAIAVGAIYGITTAYCFLWTTAGLRDALPASQHRPT